MIADVKGKGTASSSVSNLIGKEIFFLCATLDLYFIISR